MSTQATVTLVVPTYRRHTLLRECLKGIRAQSYPHFVALVCDNADDPEVGRIVGELDDPRFRWIPRPSNLGILGNVWAGFVEADTELVMEVDDDDVLAPDALALLVPPLLDDQDVVVSFGDADLVDGDGRPLPPYHPMAGLLTLDHLPVGRIRPFHGIAARGEVYMVSSVLRRDAIDWDERPDSVGTAYDRHLAVRLAGTGQAAHHVPRPVVAYRIHDEADGAHQFTSQLQGAVEVLEAELAKGVDDPAYRAILRDELTRTRILQVRSLLVDRRPGTAVRTAWCTITGPGGRQSVMAFALGYAARAPRRVVARVRNRPLEGRA